MSKLPPVAHVTMPGASAPQPVAVVRAPDAPPDAPPVLVALPKKRKPGRPRGSRSRHVLEREAALRSAMGAIEFGNVSDSLDLLRAVMRSPAVNLQDRLRCALALAPFDAPKVAPVAPPREADIGLAKRLEEAFRRTGRGWPSSAPPELTPEQQAELETMLR
ncbi:hypothetical protein [Falsiroseomonas sp.]|uniref:hypothetical protein n=1 Tax=Falsiroseomonas sp. TaxID=2870721 RepID=UPI00356B4B5E